MKRIILSVLVLCAGNFALATPNNPQAPTLKDVVVAYDVAEAEFLPFFFDWVAYADVMLDLQMDPSCPHIVVENQAVECVTSSQRIQVGTLGNKVGQHEFSALYQVNWLSNVELTETLAPSNHGYEYRIQVK